MSYSIVVFCDSEEVAAVCSSWITEDGRCFWPSRSNRKAIMDLLVNKAPVACTWDSFPIRILSTNIG